VAFREISIMICTDVENSTHRRCWSPFNNQVLVDHSLALLFSFTEAMAQDLDLPPRQRPHAEFGRIAISRLTRQTQRILRRLIHSVLRLLRQSKYDAHVASGTVICKAHARRTSRRRCPLCHTVKRPAADSSSMGLRIRSSSMRSLSVADLWMPVYAWHRQCRATADRETRTSTYRFLQEDTLHLYEQHRHD